MYRNVLEFLEETECKFPNKQAFGDDKEDISFAVLKESAMIIGTFLSQRIEIGSPVVFLMDKSVKAICGMLGAVYAGGFYTTIDTKQPESRTRSILNTLMPKVILTDKESYEKAMRYEDCADIICVEDIMDGVVDEKKLQQIREKMLDSYPLYVNFTSGSTGTPKGVVVCHRSVIDFITCFTDIFEITENDILGNQAPFDFDVSVKDIYSGLLTGAKVQIIPKKYFSMPTQLMDYLAEKEVTTLIWAVSAMCFVSVMNGLEYRVPKHVNKVMFSGEVLPIKHLKIWQKYLPDAKYVNLYGPTEITCNCTYYVLNQSFEDTDIIPIGKAFPNEKVFLLDDENKLVTESDRQGEICVSGTSVALGYYKDKERTNQVFVQNPLNDAYSEIIYRTGDIGKYDKEGNLVYVSRKDFQIKHLGHRIELGEIEALAMACEGITRTCCIYEREKQRLLLFYTGDREKKEYMKELRTILPPFMLPNMLILLDNMPLNKNGKIDRTRLQKDFLGEK